MINQAIASDNQENEIERVESQVKWYNPEKGYGFLVPEDESGDIFMHFSVLDAAGCRRVEEGDRIACDVGPGMRGRQVLRVLEVKFASREPRFSPAFLGPKTPAFDLESMEEIEG
jgi:CspA family cold shock protein